MATFKRDYENGTVTFPCGKVVNVLELPAQSMNYFAVYGFIRACQDPTGGEKDEDKKLEAQLAIGEALIAGTHEKKSRTFGAGLEDKLDEANAFLQTYIASSDADKRMLASLGISRSGYEAEIKRLEAAIKKRNAKANAEKPAKKVEVVPAGGETAAVVENYVKDTADDVEVVVEAA